MGASDSKGPKSMFSTGVTATAAASARPALTEDLRARLYHHVDRLCPDWSHHEIEDVVQETMVAAWQDLSQFTPTRSFWAWVYGIMVHRVSDYCRLKERRKEVSLDCIDYGTGHEQAQLWVSPYVDRHTAYRPALGRLAAGLGPRPRVILKLRLRNHTLKEIARQRKMTTGGVASSLHRSRKRLREWAIEEGLA